MPHKIPFHVIHVSGQDDNYRAVELNTHSPITKGWQSMRFCLFPQDMVIQLEKRSHMKKIQILSHQYLIATKVEFYVGDIPEDLPDSLQNARYTRLGYISLADNDKTSYKARELKSVQVDAVGSYLKLVIHKNHINKLNVYNQVGLVAINVIGDPVRKATDLYDDSSYKADQLIKSDHLSPLDDLAFDMYQDPEVAQIIRTLEKKKHEAVLEERYDYAKKLKQAVADLQKVGERLGKYEVEKRQAIEFEDYDKAKLKKLQMDEYRLQVYKQLEIHDLLESTGSRANKPVKVEPTRQPTPTRLDALPQTRMSPLPDRLASPDTARTYDDRPLPAMKNNGPSSLPDIEDKHKNPVPPPEEERHSPVLDDETVPEGGSGGITDGPEEMNEKDMREASAAIDIFGLSLTQKAYSKNWSFREDAMLSVLNEMNDYPTTAPKEDSRAMLKAAILLIRKGIKDKVFAVFKASVKLLKFVLTDFVPKHKHTKADISFTVEKTLPDLLHKTGDSAARHRDEAKQFILEMAHLSEVKPTHLVPVECVKPFKVSTAPRLALSRMEVTEKLYTDLGIDGSGLTVENLMPFCMEALKHHSGPVREVSERIIISLYKQTGEPVKRYLPHDDDKTRKNTLYRQLFEAFDKIDGKPSKEDLKKQKAIDEAKKMAEIEALQSQLQQLKDMTGGKGGPGENSGTKNAKKTNPKDTKKPVGKKIGPKKKASKAIDEDDTATLFNIERTCIFCGEKDESFTEEGLDIHYWKSCPMLKRCSHCKQVVEIAGLSEHLLTECESKDNFAKCPRCSEAIPKSEHDQHVKEKACNPSESSKSHCPLCHENHTSGEEEWKVHLMGKDKGCKHNTRRTTHLNKQPGKAGPKTKGIGRTTGLKGKKP